MDYGYLSTLGHESTLMTKPFVQSGYERIENDHYPTIDKRCIYGLLEIIVPTGPCVDVCAPGGSGIVDTLTKCGYDVFGIPDAFTKNKLEAEWIVTNPPYKRPLVDNIINRQIERVEDLEVHGLAVLLRTAFDHAKTRTAMFKHKSYAGQIKLLFRPLWFSGRKRREPMHHFVWHIWSVNSPTGPQVHYAKGDRSTNQTSFF